MRKCFDIVRGFQCQLSREIFPLSFKISTLYSVPRLNEVKHSNKHVVKESNLYVILLFSRYDW